MSDNAQCQAQLRKQSLWTGKTTCSSRALVWRDGVWYCWIHDPKHVAWREGRAAHPTAERNET